MSTGNNVAHFPAALSLVVNCVPAIEALLAVGP